MKVNMILKFEIDAHLVEVFLHLLKSLPVDSEGKMVYRSDHFFGCFFNWE